MALNEAELLKQKYSSAPAAIDFASYKGKVDASLLALAEKEFKGVQYPPFAELDEAKAEYEATALFSSHPHFQERKFPIAELIEYQSHLLDQGWRFFFLQIEKRSSQVTRWLQKAHRNFAMQLAQIKGQLSFVTRLC